MAQALRQPWQVFFNEPQTTVLLLYLILYPARHVWSAALVGEQLEKQLWNPVPLPICISTMLSTRPARRFARAFFAGFNQPISWAKALGLTISLLYPANHEKRGIHQLSRLQKVYYSVIELQPSTVEVIVVVRRGSAGPDSHVVRPVDHHTTGAATCCGIHVDRVELLPELVILC